MVVGPIGTEVASFAPADTIFKKRHGCAITLAAAASVKTAQLGSEWRMAGGSENGWTIASGRNRAGAVAPLAGLSPMIVEANGTTHAAARTITRVMTSPARAARSQP